jgi:hypothetical protein
MVPGIHQSKDDRRKIGNPDIADRLFADSRKDVRLQIAGFFLGLGRDPVVRGFAA